MTLAILEADVITPEAVVPSGALVVDDGGAVAYVGASSGMPVGARETLHLPNHTVVPGFIDIHTHGGRGLTFDQLNINDRAALAEALQTYASWAATTGVTGFLCTIAAPNAAALDRLVRAYAACLEETAFEGAKPLGLHLEGPYLNPEKKGAFNPEWLRAPSLDEIQTLLEAGQGWIRQMTLAPELPDAEKVTALLREAGVVPALGHSNTDYETAAAALAGQFTHVTHTFNAQRGFHHRQPGVLGAVLTSDDVTAELIADGIHVHPGAMKLMMRAVGPERIVLVTDAMAAAGLGDGEYELVGHKVRVENGEARQANGTIAGSTATLDLCVRNCVRAVGVSLEDAVRMATVNPARVINVEGVSGTLNPGAAGTFIVLDTDLQVVLTVVQGRVVYRAG